MQQELLRTRPRLRVFGTLAANQLAVDASSFMHAIRPRLAAAGMRLVNATAKKGVLIPAANALSMIMPAK